MCLCVRDITVDRPTGEQYLGNHIIFLMLFCFIIVFSYDCQQQQQQQQIEELEGKQKMQNKEISVKDSKHVYGSLRVYPTFKNFFSTFGSEADRCYD